VSNGLPCFEIVGTYSRYKIKKNNLHNRLFFITLKILQLFNMPQLQVLQLLFSAIQPAYLLGFINLNPESHFVLVFGSPFPIQPFICKIRFINLALKTKSQQV
jgi:hypothetical protein